MFQIPTHTRNHSLTALLLLITLLTLTSCNRKERDSTSRYITSEEKAKAELREAVDIVSKSCPIHTDTKTTLDGATYRDNVWTYYYTVTEDSVIRFDNEAFNETIRTSLKQSTMEHIVQSPDMLTMLRALARVNADLTYEYRGSISDNVIMVTFSYAEIRVIMDMMVNKNAQGYPQK